MKFLNRFNILLLIVALVGAYFIWPVPFWYLNRKALSPSLNFIKKVGLMIYEPVGELAQVSSLARENKNLQAENQRLQALVADLKEKKSIEDVITRDLTAKLSFRDSRELIVARVVGRSSTGSNYGFIINRGSNDSIEEGSAVVSNGYLVGVIKKVHADQSEVLLVNNYNSLIPVVLENSRMSGLMRGGINGLVIEDVPIEGEFKVGENVLSSGLGGVIPQGIPLGQTVSMQSSKGDLFSKISVSSPIIFSKIEIVEIVK